MSIIRLLPESIANQIAAGEVVQRPASVVKELMENAIDSGASEIALLIKDSGKSLIQVTDNGCGMDEADARMAFERHATSKIKAASDLFDLHTKGFRGEALASIAAVAQVSLLTRNTENDIATRILIEGSEFKKVEPATANVGSTFAVKNLFYNTPARRNFLKSDAVEMKHITEEFIRVALPHPDIHFKLQHNNHIIYDLRSSNPRQRVVSIFGKNHNEKLVPVSEESLMLNLSGFVGKAEVTRKTRGEQYLFVNRRFVKSNYFNHAIVKAYGDLIAPNSYPFYVLMMEVEPDRIDVNIHPTKTEIKFQDEKALYQLIQASVKKALGIYNVKPTLDFEQPPVPITHVDRSTEIKAPQIQINPEYNPFKGGYTGTPTPKPQQAPEALKDLYKIQQEFDVDWKKEESNRPTQQRIEPQDKEPDTTPVSPTEQPSREEFIQVAQRYILTKIRSGFILIDQQRAHQRVLFEGYLAKLASGTSPSQQQLFPERIHIPAKNRDILEHSKETLERLGLQFSFFATDEIVVNALPEGLVMRDMHGFLEEFFEHMHAPKVSGAFGFQEKLAYSLALSGSIRYGRTLAFNEMQTLVGDLFACSNPKQAPNGKACSVQLDVNDIEKLLN